MNNCPFCSTAPCLVTETKRAHSYVLCEKCGARGPVEDKGRSAIDAWNRGTMIQYESIIPGDRLRIPVFAEHIRFYPKGEKQDRLTIERTPRGISIQSSTLGVVVRPRVSNVVVVEIDDDREAT